MLKKATHSLAFLLALTVLAAPVSALYAQSTDLPVVSGGDPEPTGEPVPKAMSPIQIEFLIVLATLGLA